MAPAVGKRVVLMSGRNAVCRSASGKGERASTDEMPQLFDQVVTVVRVDFHRDGLRVIEAANAENRFAIDDISTLAQRNGEGVPVGDVDE